MMMQLHMHIMNLISSKLSANTIHSVSNEYKIDIYIGGGLRDSIFSNSDMLEKVNKQQKIRSRISLNKLFLHNPKDYFNSECL